MSLTGTSFPPILNTLKNHPLLVLGGDRVKPQHKLVFLCFSPLLGNPNNHWFYNEAMLCQRQSCCLAGSHCHHQQCNQTFCSLWHCLSAENWDGLVKIKKICGWRNQASGLVVETDEIRKQHCTKTQFLTCQSHCFEGRKGSNAAPAAKFIKKFLISEE